MKVEVESFFSLLERRVDDCSSLLCVGLDPHPNDLPAPTAEAARQFCLRIIKATAPYAAAFKPNAAFFEALGADGWHVLKSVIEAARHESERLGSHIPVILDAKRGDIASTAETYARSAFSVLGADAITLSPYLGRDAIEPFVRDREKGAFLLCKTSNPGSADLQDLLVHGADAEAVPLHLHVARLAAEWNTGNNIGIVVGATFPQALSQVRQAAQDLWILVPGVGAQAGDLSVSLAAGLRPDGKGVLINVSRAISRAPDPGRAAADLRDAINESRRARPSGTVRENTGIADSLADELLQAGCIQFGGFKLKSGLTSPIYIDLRRLISHPGLLGHTADAYLRILRGLQFDRVAALPYAAIPIATAACLAGRFPMVYPRKEPKEYGMMAAIEGEYVAGERVVLVDDLATTGGSKFEAIEKLKGAGLQVSDVVVLIDRESGAREALSQAGYNLHAVVTITQLLDHWERARTIEPDRIRAAREFIASKGV